jgi:lipoate-protein ligase A
MGISGKPEELIHIPSVRQDKIPVIKRFSGGGTVIVDENTLFISFILSKDTLNIHPFPEPILQWSTKLYKDAWQIPNFHLRENDYCIGLQKCGGNAQYIKKERWLHHTSFLWDYQGANMNCLLMPAKKPTYRQDRTHIEFLTRLKNYVCSPNTLIEGLKRSIVKQLYISEFDLSSWEAKPHRQSTSLLDL